MTKALTYTESEQRELDLRASAAEDHRMERIPADYYDFPYDGHAIWHPTWGLRLQCDDQGYALLSASEARRFADWLKDATRNIPLPKGEELADG